MKSKITALSLALFAALLTGCANDGAPAAQPTATAKQVLPYLRTSASLATTGVLISQSASNRVILAKNLNNAALGLTTITGQTVPTAAQVQNYITSAFPNDPNAAVYASLGSALGSLYAGVYPKMQSPSNDNVALSVTAINDIAAGIQDAVKPYITTTATAAQ